MNNIKNVFNIKDLENLSGIKAHTIRIWEKRYKVLQPMRSDTNIRYYDVQSLQKLLNISTLHSFGYKISAISKMPEEKIPVLVREILRNKNMTNHVLNSFKLAMMNFDQALFINTYNTLLREKSFREIFYDLFIPLMHEIGFLWQTGTITPAHEHFISFLIKQKLAANTEKLMIEPPVKTDRTFVLFLPMNEIHELGLMFVNYELILSGHKAIYLGERVPTSSLVDVKKYFNNITFITYLTVQPEIQKLNPYIEELKSEILNDDDTKLFILGKMGEFIQREKLNDKIKIIDSIGHFKAFIEYQK
ncbi:MerR family transcriptional regulator [Flavobacterium cyanobacteriorum]|uniref:MerR family transcriptional regulator n=1 Tax=Flavobacterium cyanobacteriorum TaxID=2022802 RepID=A0A255Z3L2_9FLAO|nr:MerR family transcriptional regulator [Flavobacterium cyanobacteriorum]OYQ35475.1 MerR family transcriptional regulator [Flavobacterium cyanobacteriorum]